METSAIQRACAAIGGQSALAREIGTTPQAVQKMCSTGRVPAERVIAIERVSGVSRHELRPDLYPVEQAAA
jgi:DNA-binding transcriptional regulator YdaS (Cro superfamily)